MPTRGSTVDQTRPTKVPGKLKIGQGKLPKVRVQEKLGEKRKAEENNQGQWDDYKTHNLAQQ